MNRTKASVVDISHGQRPRGRPTIRTTGIVNKICHRIARGESLRHICLDPRMPCRDTVFRWLRSDQKRRLKLRALLSALQDEQLNKA
jgi:hypothetical protein